jgi:hypothetical protein
VQICTDRRRGANAGPLPGQCLGMEESTSFTVRAALAGGATPGALRSTRLAAPFHGVRSTTEPFDTHTRCRAYASKMRRDAVFSSVTAARLWGIPLPLWVRDDIVHVATAHGTARPGGRGVHGTQFMSGSVRFAELAGLRVLSAEDTWASLASVLGLADLVAAGDFLVTTAFTSTAAPLTSVSELASVAARRRLRGRAIAEQAAGLVRVGALSRPESLTRVLAVTGGVPEPACNYRVSPLLMFDLGWPDLRFGLDYHGASHRSARQHAKDVARDDLARAHGWGAMQAGATDLFDAPFDLLTRLRSRLIERGAPVRPLVARKVALATR